MAMNIPEKILSGHLVEGELKVGKEIGIRIDQVLTQDATGTMAYLQFEAIGAKRVKCDLAVSYIDHNTLQVGFENADDHAYLKSVAAKFGIVLSRPGNGICHQLHLERFGIPGKTLVGSDSHTPTGGGLGMLAIGVGGIDAAVAMGGGTFYLATPKVVKIELKGKLPDWVTAKDVVLSVLDKFKTKGNVGRVFEYGGPGVANLEVPERATITNMGAECGVTTSVFPSDDITKQFMEAQGRGDDWQELSADPDAQYEKVIEIDLSTLNPLAATPHSPGNISSVAALSGTKVDQVMIGSCTNSSYKDLKTVAKLLEGKKISPEVELGIACGSRQVFSMLSRDGSLSHLIDAGARIMENACGFCIGCHASPKTDAVSLRTSNRNFEGRSGTKSAQVYLVSPVVAVMSALEGRMVDPTLLQDVKFPKVKQPKQFDIDDSMFIFPGKSGKDVALIKGPNIGDVPVGDKLGDTLKGVVTIKLDDKITTDHIMPAGQRLKYRSNVPEYSKYVFENTDADFVSRAEANRNAGVANVIVAGDSYGQGSSREHAALCPMYLGVKAVIAKSIERIHCANLINFGIIPFFFVKASDHAQIEQGDELLIEGVKAAVSGDGKAVLKNVTKGCEIPLKVDLSERQKGILAAGGLLNTVGKKKK
jgi:aconitate hydratase